MIADMQRFNDDSTKFADIVAEVKVEANELTRAANRYMVHS